VSQLQSHVAVQPDSARGIAASIFIVEDELVVSKDIEHTLRELGYRVLGRARSGTAALLKITQLKPDLILMDIGLPGGVDGVVTAAAIRDQTAIPVVFLSGLVDVETLDRAGCSDPFGYVVKPFKPAELRGAIEIALRRSRSEASARARERLLLTTLQAIGDALITTNDREEIAFLNPVAERFTGWSLDGALGRTLGEVLQLRDETTGEPVLSPREALEKRCATRSPKGTLLVGKSRTVAIDCSSAPVFADDATLLGVVIVFRDATETQRLEGQVRAYQKMDIVGQLTSAIAHDFNNVLSAILLCSRFLAGSFDKDDPRRQDMEEIEKSGNRGAALTRQLLTFGGRNAIDPTPISLNDVVTELEHMLRLLSGQTEVHFNGAADPGLVTVDRGQIEQVLVNLVINARDAMPSGGPLEIETRNVELEPETLPGVHHLRPGSYVTLAVTDSGCGMDAETQRRAFEPFFSTKERGKGTGLGLSSSYEIIKQYGGDIQLVSEVGRGTSFVVYLPRSEGRANSYTRELSAHVAGQELETILLIENDVSMRAAVARTLESCGYQVLRASDRHDAIAVIEAFEGPLHLVLSDVLPPRREEGRAPSALESRCAGVPALFMSGYADDWEGLGLASKMELQVIRKPFVSDALARKVRTSIDSQSPPSRSRG